MSMKLRCLIVDDEPIAQQILEKYISQLDALSLVAKCNNAFEAMNTLHKEKIDLMFLDIRMPTLSGLEMLKSLSNAPKVILTTAYAEFAIDGYEFGIVDYLLKPISFERFLKAVNKILMPHYAKLTMPHSGEKSSEPTFIFFKADKKIYKFYHSEIFFFEGCGNYVKVYNEKEKPILVLDKLSELQGKLPSDFFVRVHKSYIVNVMQIQHLEGNLIKIGQKELPISVSYKEQLMKIVTKK